MDDAPIPPPRLQRDAPLAPVTTLELGGPAAALIEATTSAEVGGALRWARSERLPAFVLGGGSNVVVADAGWPGAVIRIALRGFSATVEDDTVLVEVAAGEPWDDLVARTVAEGWAGLECLSGIPGTVGATPVQNVGAYGREVAETVAAVTVLDRTTLDVATLAPEQCAFAYRDSAFRRTPGHAVILSVRFRLRRNGRPAVRYPELAAALDAGPHAPDPGAVRAAVLELRRSKSMVLDADDPNRRSVGSFFLNPVVPEATARRVLERAASRRVATRPEDVPAFPTGDGSVKLSAAWLVENAGFPRGLRRDGVGISSRHALALVHHGDGSTAALLALAADIRAAVHERFGIDLRPEPVLLGCTLAGPPPPSR